MKMINRQALDRPRYDDPPLNFGYYYPHKRWGGMFQDTVKLPYAGKDGKHIRFTEEELAKAQPDVVSLEF
jgi:hypothetical protein